MLLAPAASSHWTQEPAMKYAVSWPKSMFLLSKMRSTSKPSESHVFDSCVGTDGGSFAPAGFLPFWEGIVSINGACLFSAYLAYHTKLIVAGKHTKYQRTKKITSEYAFGAMSLYNDIINVLFYLPLESAGRRSTTVSIICQQ